MKKILYLVITILLFTACGGLSRGKAKEEIIKAMQLPQKETIKLNKRFLKDHQYVGGFPKVCLTIGMEKFHQYEKQLTDLQAQGYITLKDDDYYNDCNDLYTNVIITEKGKKDLLSETDGQYEIRLCSIEFGGVTGIVEYKEFKAADVRYTLVRTDYSEFGKLVKSINPYGNSQDITTIARLANFTKYDDGWRIGK
jgi:hypothetical protein